MAMGRIGRGADGRLAAGDVVVGHVQKPRLSDDQGRSARPVT